MKKIFLIIITVVFTTNASQVLSTIQQFLPKPTEIGFLTGIVNCYIQVSQFVRTTNTIVNNIKEAKNTWEAMTTKIENLYESVKSLKNIDPYDMNTWINATNQAQFILADGMTETKRLFNATEYFLVDANLNALNSFKTEEMYREFQSRTGANIRDLYSSQQYKSAIIMFSDAKNKTLMNRLRQIDAEIAIIREDPESENELAILYEEKKVIEQTIMADYPLEENKIDSIINEAQQLIATNMSEIKMSEQRINSMRNVAMDLVASYEDIIEGNIGTKRIFDTENIIEEVVPEADQYGTHPNKVPAPNQPSNVKSAYTNKKESNQQDAVALQNNIKMLLYKQECLNRDITAMKCNIMSFVLAIEALKQYKEENQALVQNVHLEDI